MGSSTNNDKQTTVPTVVLVMTIGISALIALAALFTSIELARLQQTGNSALRIFGQDVATESVPVAVAALGMMAVVMIARLIYRTYRR